MSGCGWASKMNSELGPVEKEIYEYIKKAGEVMAKEIPRDKAGAIPNLVNKGLVMVEKRRLSCPE